MSKKLLLSLIFMVPIALYAQSNLTYGARAGLNYSNSVWVSDGSVDSQGNEYRTGFHIGAAMKLQLFDQLYLAPEFLFSNKGYKSDAGDKIHHNYLALPIFLEYRPITKLAIKAGPEVAYLLSAKNKVGGTTIDLFDFWGSDMNRWDMGLGAGLEWSLTDEIALGMRYFHGLGTIIELQLTDEMANPLSEVKLKNRSIQLSLAYSFGQ